MGAAIAEAEGASAAAAATDDGAVLAWLPLPLDEPFPARRPALQWESAVECLLPPVMLAPNVLALSPLALRAAADSDALVGILASFANIPTVPEVRRVASTKAVSGEGLTHPGSSASPISCPENFYRSAVRKAMWRERGGWWLLGRAHSFIHFVHSNFLQILVRVDAIDLVRKLSKSEPSSRFFSRLKISKKF